MGRGEWDVLSGCKGPWGTISYLGFGRSSETGAGSSSPAAPGTEAHLCIDGCMFAGREKAGMGGGTGLELAWG